MRPRTNGRGADGRPREILEYGSGVAPVASELLELSGSSRKRGTGCDRVHRDGVVLAGGEPRFVAAGLGKSRTKPGFGFGDRPAGQRKRPRRFISLVERVNRQGRYS